MAHNVSGASLTPIYERLNDVNNYHPLDAETFADWSMEAGDIVTVSRDGKDYASPVHTSTMTWRGKTPVVAINATGKQHRDPPAKVSRQKYARSGAGMRNNQGLYYEITSEDGILHSSILMTESVLRTEFNNTASDLHSAIEETAEHIRSEVYTASSQVYSYVNQTASNIRQEVGNEIEDVHSAIEQTASSIRSEVYTSSSQVYSYIQQTASNIRQEVGNEIEDVHSAIEQTASAIRSEVYTSSSQVYSYINQTASNIRQEVGNEIADVHSAIEQTESSIRSDVYASSSQLYSYVNQTASNIRQEIGNEIEDVHSAIEQTADSIRSTVNASNSQIYSFVNQTASNIRSEVGDTVSEIYTVIDQTSSAIILEVKKGAKVFHQYSDPALTEETKNGDIWVKDTGASTHGSAGSFTYGQLGSFRYAEFFGQEIYIRKNGAWEGPIGGSQAENISRARIEEAEDHIAIITDNMGGDYAEFIVEMGRIRSRVDDVESGLQSTIEQTASMIRSSVWTANSEMYSEIIQTQSMIRSEVYNAESRMNSTVTQTASSLTVQISRKRAQYIQLEDPSLTNTMYDGDLWIIDRNVFTHAAMSLKTFAQLGNEQYIDFMGKVTKVWKGGQWLPYYDERAQHVDETKVEINENGISMLKGDLSEQYSRFLIEKEQIRSIVQDKINGVGSQITQTATSIRSELWASNSQVYSSIQQTASNIRSLINNEIEDVHSEIEQTANSIRSTVYAANSQVYSYVNQTSSQIQSTVGNQITNLQSQITQEANKIALVVSGTGTNAKIDPAKIVAAINNGESSVVIQANHIQLNGDTVAQSLMGKSVGAYFLGCDDLQVTAKMHIDYDADWKLDMGSTTPVRNTLVGARVENNTLFLINLEGDEIPFSKATALTPSWSGSVLTLAATQTNNGTTETVARKTLGFGGSYGSHDIELGLTQNGYPSRNSATQISVPVKVIQQQGGGSTTDRYSMNLNYSIASLLQEKSVSSDGSVTPDSGYIGLSKVTVSGVHSTRFTLKCTAATPVNPQSNVKNYTFTMQSAYSFSSGSNYYFYR